MNGWIKRGFIAFAALLGGVALALFVVTRDEPTPDISHIAETRPPVADTDNAFLGLLAVGAELSARAEKDPALLAALTDATPASARDARAIRAISDATIDLKPAWLEALARPRSLAPAHRNADAPPYPFSDIHHLGRLATLWAESEAVTHPPSALLVDLAALRAAHHVSDSYDTLIVYLYGVACANLATSHLQETAARNFPAPALARELIASIERSRSDDEAFAALFRNEMHFALRYAHTLDPAKTIAQWESMGFASPPRAAARFFKRNQTARWGIEELRACLAQADGRPFTAVSLPEPDRGSPELFWGLPHPDNALGRHLAAQRVVSYAQVFAFRARQASSLSALQAWLAVRSYQAEHGKLPPDLATLVPVYFARVPIDFNDGQPIRYSPATRAIWSVGANAYQVAAADSEPTAGEIDYRLPAD